MPLNISWDLFLLCISVVAVITLLVWKLPNGVKPRGLSRAWRGVSIATLLYFIYYSYPILPQIQILSPILYFVFLIIMAATLIDAAEQNCKPVWTRLLACLILNLAISVILFIMELKYQPTYIF